LLSVSHIAGIASIVIIAALHGSGISLYLRNIFIVGIQLLGVAYFGGLTAINFGRINLSDWFQRIREIKLFWLDGVLDELFGRFVVLLIGYSAGETVLGFFHQASRLAKTPHKFLQQFTSRVMYNFFSRNLSNNKERQTLNYFLSLELAILIPTATAGYFLADPLIPFIFGDEWEPVVPLFLALLGVTASLSSFETLASLYRAKKHLESLILWGKIPLYATVVLAWLILDTVDYSPSTTIALSVSISYVFTTFLLILNLTKIPKDTG
jgi:O-antigen/teichoic acid export membrane protein